MSSQRRTILRAGAQREDTLEDKDGDTKVMVEESTDEDKIRFVTAGMQRVMIEESGQVGIGTENPSAKLHLASASTDDLLFLETTEDSNAASPVIKLKRNSGSPADADYLGQLKFQGENNADQNVTYAKITGKIGSVTDGQEQGIIEFANMKNGSSGITARLRHDSLQLVNSTNLTVDGSIGIGTTSPTEALDIDSDSIRLRQSKTPSSSSDTGKAGQIAYDSNYIYVCVATNTWKRVELSTW